MTIVEFLEARLAEDELTANAAIDVSAEWHALYDYRDVKDADGGFVVQADSQRPTTGQAAHIARQDPARALLECEAKRLLIAVGLRSSSRLRPGLDLSCFSPAPRLVAGRRSFKTLSRYAAVRPAARPGQPSAVVWYLVWHRRK